MTLELAPGWQGLGKRGSGAVQKGRVFPTYGKDPPHLQYFVVKRSIVTIYALFESLLSESFQRGFVEVSESLHSSKGKFVKRAGGFCCAVHNNAPWHKTGNSNYHCHHFHRCHHHLCHHHAAAYLTSIVSRQYPPISPICPSPSLSSSS